MTLEELNARPYGKAPQDSYWQQGVNDARAGIPFDESKRWVNGYLNGWNFGMGHPPQSPWNYQRPYPTEDTDEGPPEDDNYCPHCGRSD